MQASDRPYVEHPASHEFTSSLTLNTLTLNHGNLTRNPKLDSREVKYMSMKERPLIMMMLQNVAHIICLNEADAFICPEDENSKDASPSCSSNLATRASFSNPRQQNQSHALSAAESKPDSNYWHDTFPPKANTGVRHLECSGAKKELH